MRIFFNQKGYELFDKIAVHLNRKEQWIKILEDFVGQLQAHVSLFDRKQMETACYIEDMLYMYKPEMKRVLREERGRRGHKVKKDGKKQRTAVRRNVTWDVDIKKMRR